MSIFQHPEVVHTIRNTATILREQANRLPSEERFLAEALHGCSLTLIETVQPNHTEAEAETILDGAEDLFWPRVNKLGRRQPLLKKVTSNAMKRITREILTQSIHQFAYGDKLHLEVHSRDCDMVQSVYGRAIPATAEAFEEFMDELGQQAEGPTSAHMITVAEYEALRPSSRDLVTEAWENGQRTYDVTPVPDGPYNGARNY